MKRHATIRGRSNFQKLVSVVFDLGPFLMNNGIFTYWTGDNTPAFTTDNSVDLRNNNIYVNAHNDMFPGGETHLSCRKSRPRRPSAV